MSVKKINAVLLILALSALAACVQLPTEKTSIVDQRPQISFRFTGDLGAARVFVDDLDAGSIGEFADGRAALRVLPGTHTVRVVHGDNVLLIERAYLADGAVRPFIIK